MAGFNFSQMEAGKDGFDASDDFNLGWQYLRDEIRLPRAVETLEIVGVRRGRQVLDLDLALPALAEGEERGERETAWYVPAAFLGKKPIAPDLEVRDGMGGVIPVPTKPANMELTAWALDRLAEDGQLGVEPSPELSGLVHDVISKEAPEARVSTILIEENFGPLGDLFQHLLEELEDQFLLWIPLRGRPGMNYHVSMRRRQHRHVPPILARRRIHRRYRVDTALGPVSVEAFPAQGRFRFRPRAALERILLVLGILPFEFEHETSAPRRFASYHLRVLAPPGFVVRDLRAESGDPGFEDEEETGGHRLTNRPGTVVQGHNAEVAHVHLAHQDNPASVFLRVTFGIREGLNTLWVLAVVLTAALLWAFHRHEVQTLLQGHHGELDAAAAVLLIGPAAVSAWAISTGDQGELLRSAVSVARFLLLASAVLSVATAMSLDGFLPGLATKAAIEVYASAAFAIAVVIIVGWVGARRPTWFFYRNVLTSPRRNLAGVAVLCTLLVILAIHQHSPFWLAALLLFGLGLGLAAIATNRTSTGLFEEAGVFPPLAAIAAVPAIAAAGYFFGYYSDVVDAKAIWTAILVSEGTVLLATIRALFI
jgi:hypothetical protein